VSATQPETFSPKNLVVLGGLLAIALILGEIVVGPAHDGGMPAVVADTIDDVAMRLKPVITLDDIRSGKSTGGSAGMTVAAAASDNASKTPEQLYQGACFACHGTGAAGAPKLGDTAAWADRIAKGLDALVTSAVGGIGAMPPRGGSQYDDDHIRSVIQFMVDKAK
jgi:cytochrome c5